MTFLYIALGCVHSHVLSPGQHGRSESLIMSWYGFPVKVAIGYDPLGSSLELSMVFACHPMREAADSALNSVGYLSVLFTATWSCGALFPIPCLGFLICELTLTAIFHLKFCQSK